MLSAVYSRQDRIEEARLWLARAKEKSPGELQASAQSLLFIAETELAIAEERWEEAISKSDSLFNWYKRGVMHWDQAHALLNLAEIHRMRGLPEDQERAIELYGQSREIFEEIGAAGYVEIVDERLSLLQGQSIRPKE
jgi:tetratricopeptide (TPR) repeat protein